MRKTLFAVTDTIRQFTDELGKSLENGTFVKATIGNYTGDDETLQKIYVRPVETKKGSRLLFQFRGAKSDRVKNFAAPDALRQIGRYLSSGFRSGHLFTTTGDIQLRIGKRSSRLIKGKPTFSTAVAKGHDREKQYRIDPNSYFLKALGITTDKGEIRANQRDKWKQINKFVEVLAGLYENSELKVRPSINIVDMGSGKGYLTFAAYDYFGSQLSSSAVSVTGVETRRELVDLCNQIARAGDLDGLNFIQGSIADINAADIDILIALHACDTATDDALYKGITSNASIIVAAPCCHKEIKKQLTSPELLAGILKHPVLFERTAETLTDGIRSMLLEASGYKTKMFEFVATEHTPKNNLLVARRSANRAPENNFDRIAEICDSFGIGHQRLAFLLGRKEN